MLIKYRLRIVVESVDEDGVETIAKSEHTIDPEKFEGVFDTSNALALFKDLNKHIDEVFHYEDD